MSPNRNRRSGLLAALGIITGSGYAALYLAYILLLTVGGR